MLLLEIINELFNIIGTILVYLGACYLIYRLALINYKRAIEALEESEADNHEK